MVSIANVSQTDKMLRIVFGVVAALAAFLFLGGTGTMGGIITLIVSVVLVVTGLFNFCPAYKIFGIATLKKTS